MPLKHVTSKDNPLYRTLLALAEDRQARRQRQQTLLDGEHLLQEALAAGLRPSRLILVEDAVASPWAERLGGVPKLILPPALLRKLSPLATPTGLMAVIDIPEAAAGAMPSDCIVLLDAIQDPGNLGALLRIAAAAGVGAAYLSPGCTDAWSPKALRGGQGAQFRLVIHEEADLLAVARDFTGPVYAAMPRAAQSLFALALTGPVGFVFGNEGAGLDASLAHETMPFSIPMPGGMESLNVASAAAICLFERVRQLAASRGWS